MHEKSLSEIGFEFLQYLKDMEPAVLANELEHRLHKAEENWMDIKYAGPLLTSESFYLSDMNNKSYSCFTAEDDSIEIEAA